LGIEADLGIDSIKRVEILNSFQQRCKAEEQAKLQESMERLRSEERRVEKEAELGEALGSCQTAPPTAQPDQPTEESHRVGDNLQSGLVVLVAHLTGVQVCALAL